MSTIGSPPPSSHGTDTARVVPQGAHTPQVDSAAVPRAAVVPASLDVNGAQPRDTSGFTPNAGLQFEPQGSALATQSIPAFPESIPEPNQITYSEFAQQLKANPRVNYIELDRRDTNAGLAEFLNHYGAAIEAHPELRAKLEQSEAGQLLLQALDSAKDGRLGTEDIIKLQTFIVASGAGHVLQHPNSETGIDGDYGPKTHAALQQVFADLVDGPDAMMGRFDQPVTQGLPATEGPALPSVAQNNYYMDAQEGETMTQFALRQADAQRTDRRDMGNMINRDTELSEHYEVPSDLPASTSTGTQVVAAARRVAPEMRDILAALQRRSGRRHYRCYQGVKKVLNQLNPPISLSGGSAYMAADQLRSRYADRFQSIQTLDPNSAQTKAYLRSLPAGAIVVWGRNESASARARNPHNGYSHGHISVAMGGGQEFSDRYRNQITNNDGRYGNVTVFIPN